MKCAVLEVTLAGSLGAAAGTSVDQVADLR